MDESYEHPGVELTSTQEERLVADTLHCRLVGTARQHNLSERACPQLSVKVGEVDVVVGEERGERREERGLFRGSIKGCI